MSSVRGVCVPSDLTEVYVPLGEGLWHPLAAQQCAGACEALENAGERRFMQKDTSDPEPFSRRLGPAGMGRTGSLKDAGVPVGGLQAAAPGTGE